ncbi:unnamed protein product [Arabidopsis lyrata]|uniref:IQ-domain 19 n=1 Tax=Arabidopsis lyrata subsp. lyrata TaxID=81972 RepID=D7MBC9_ARALL|nr:protein IQ-DOMAIN 32 [Arabidopsis lyrata subsp. lyrata]EFH46546.1 IQ-domain 19 [Arabidopsis lyrata subsp. lyrata]CAH8276658.1 unnamed protein product [Arabidopsis lyrata]|eukprot:XP_020874697.1 protein IQ-DOMAIN 32 [Arabidopsis lyrata subsp. lyrata]
MGKTSKWIRSLLTGKKERTKEHIIQSECGFTSSIPGTPKEKRRWSFRRSSATGPPPACAITLKDSPPPPPPPPPQPQPLVVAIVDNEDEQIKNVSGEEIEEFAAIKIQACYRSHLARKALRALKGLVKLQALVRGHLVRKQATATLRCMQALITLQAKAREQRIRMIGGDSTNPRTSIHKTRINNLYQENEENIKIVEMDIQSKMYSPAPSALTEMSPRAYSSHFEDCNSFNIAQSSPQCFSRFKEYYNGDTLSSYDYPLFPNYMANTQSSKAKARSQSAPKQRPPEIYEKQMSGRRRSSMEAPRNNGVPRAVRMQRSSSQLGSNTAKESQQHQHHHQYYPWMAIKLDKSNISLMESECGSTSTVMTNTNYGRHVDVQGNSMY